MRDAAGDERRALFALGPIIRGSVWEAIAIPEAGCGYSIVVPALPGCVTEAETIEEARENVI